MSAYSYNPYGAKVLSDKGDTGATPLNAQGTAPRYAHGMMSGSSYRPPGAPGPDSPIKEWARYNDQFGTSVTADKGPKYNRDGSITRGPTVQGSNTFMLGPGGALTSSYSSGSIGGPAATRQVGTYNPTRGSTAVPNTPQQATTAPAAPGVGTTPYQEWLASQQASAAPVGAGMPDNSAMDELYGFEAGTFAGWREENPDATDDEIRAMAQELQRNMALEEWRAREAGLREAQQNVPIAIGPDGRAITRRSVREQEQERQRSQEEQRAMLDYRNRMTSYYNRMIQRYAHTGRAEDYARRQVYHAALLALSNPESLREAYLHDYNRTKKGPQFIDEAEEMERLRKLYGLPPNN